MFLRDVVNRSINVKETRLPMKLFDGIKITFVRFHYIVKPYFYFPEQL